MARLILKSPYLKPTSKTQIGTYINYIATREGVVTVNEYAKYRTETHKQHMMINTLLEKIPSLKETPEYEDYFAKQSVENAANLIETGLNILEASEENIGMYVKYIAERPRVEKIGTHGLFTDEGETVVLSKAVEQVCNSESNVWGHIISLTREDAERLGYNTVEAWMNLLRSQRNVIAEQMHINPKNFRWYAAFHNEGHHPHVHLIAYSINPNEAYLTPQGILNIKSALAKQIFKDERINIYQEQTEYRDELKQSSKVIVSDFIKQINSGVLENPIIENLLIELSKKLSETEGKKQYGYLNKSTKQLVNVIVDELEKDERIDSLYEMWHEKENEIISFYTDEVPKRKPLSQNKVFRSIKNMVVSEAMHILAQTEAERFFESESEYPEVRDEESDSDMPYDNSEYALLKGDAKKGNVWAQYKLAKYLSDENNEEYNPDEAIGWYISSANRKNSVAQYMLGKIYLQGELTLKDVPTALKWLEKAIENGNQYAEYLLGKEYLKGEDLPYDTVTAAQLLKASADKGNMYAQYTLGKLLFEGKEYLQNRKEGLKLIQQSAEQGFIYAQYYLGKLYSKGEGVPKNLKKALSLLSQAGFKNNPNALYLLGKIFSTEESAIDMEKAIRCYRLSAKHGNTFAEYQLGRIYLYGKGVDKDYYKAIEYLTLAASKGNQYAQQLLYSAERHRNAYAATGGLSLLKSIARAMQESIIDRERKNRLKASTDYIDKKTRSKINEKKQAHGLKVEM